MQILVTGGTGFIGQALCPALRQAGHEVCVLTRDRQRAVRLLPEVQAIQSIHQAPAVQAVVNLAGEPLASGRWNSARKQCLRDSRINLTRQLHDWIAQLPDGQRPRCLVSGSAIGYYGERGDTVLTESTASGTDFAAQLTGDWEAQAQRIATLGVQVSCLRIGIVLERGGGALAKMLPAFRFGGGGPFGDGRHWQSWIHRADLVSLIAWLIVHGGPGPYNGTAPNPVTNAEFARTLAQVLRRPSILRVPSIALRLALGEMANLVLTSQRVVPKRALAEGFQFQHAHLRPALEHILSA